MYGSIGSEKEPGPQSTAKAEERAKRGHNRVLAPESMLASFWVRRDWTSYDHRTVSPLTMPLAVY